MNRINTQLPQVPIPQPPKTDWFSRHHLWGYGFLALAFLLAVGFIYQMEYGRKPKENRICIQMITQARNQQTGEVKDFPTPCDVPEGWTPTNNEEIQNGSTNYIQDNILCDPYQKAYAVQWGEQEVKEFSSECEIPSVNEGWLKIQPEEVSRQVVTYENPLYNYEVTYNSKNLTRRDGTPNTVNFQYVGYCECQFITIEVSDKTLADLEKEVNDIVHQNAAQDTYRRREIRFAGESAIEISIGMDIGGIMRYKFFTHGGKTYLIKAEENTEIFDPVVASFKFIK